MDVQAAGVAATVLPPGSTTPPLPAPVSVSSPSAPSVAPVSAGPSIVSAPSGTDSGSSSGNNGTSGSSSGGANAIGPTPGLATLPAGPPDGSKKGSELQQSVSSGIAQLFNVQEQQVTVSFQIQQDPNEIVMVFTDKQTGKVIVQFPSETMLALAKLFNKLDGNVVNKKV